MLTVIFPDQVEVIKRLRAEDATFAEICRDYETLSCLLPRDTADPTFPAIRESLTALEDEIRTILDCAPGNADHRRRADQT